MASEIFATPPADPGTRLSRSIALLAAVLLAGLLIFLQNSGAVKALFEKGLTEQQQAEMAADVVPPSPAEPFTLSARFAVQAQNLPPAFADDPVETMDAIERFTATPADRVRAAVVAGELLGDDEAISRLDRLDESLPKGSALHEDVADLLVLYTQGPGRSMSKPARGSVRTTASLEMSR